MERDDGHTVHAPGWGLSAPRSGTRVDFKSDASRVVFDALVRDVRHPVLHEGASTALEAETRVARPGNPVPLDEVTLSDHPHARFVVVADGREPVLQNAVAGDEDVVRLVKTRSEKIDRIRKTILGLLLVHAPDSPVLKDFANEYGALRDRFPAENSFCIHCGLCVRYCAEVVGQHAVGFIDRGIWREIAFLPEIALTECPPCKA